MPADDTFSGSSMTAPPIDACSATTADFPGRRVVTFGGCNYLGLAQHPRVTAAAAGAIARFGLSTSASRETTGNTRAHHDLETAMAAFCAHPAGLLVPDGYIANLAAMQALARLGFRDAVVDARSHASLRDAAGMAGMRIHPYRHRDAADAGRALNACAGPAVLATDSVFAADGAVATACDLLDATRPGDVLLLDDCHGFGVLGRNGRGLADALGLRSDRLLVTTTLAKALGCGGGMVMGPDAMISAARTGSTAYICTTPCSPVLASAGLEALRVLEDEPALHERLHANTARVRGLLASEFGVDAAAPAPIIAFTAGTPDAMRSMHLAALDAGVLAPLVEYPGGPAPVYFRLSVSALHTQAQIELLSDTLHGAHRASATGSPP
jgi:8-amino-7-oxononanoate synthase